MIKQICNDVQASRGKQNFRQQAAAARGPALRPLQQLQHPKPVHRRPTVTATASSSTSAGSSWPYKDSNSSSDGGAGGLNVGQHTHTTWRTGPDAASSSNRHSNLHHQQQQPGSHGNPALDAVASLPPLFVAAIGSLASTLVAVLEIGADAFAAQTRRAARLVLKLWQPESRLLLEGCQLGACLLFILLYVWSTYSPVVPGGPRWWCDLVLCLVFAADYGHRILVTSSHPLLAMLHPLALIDLLSFAPSLVGAVLPLYSAPWGIDLRWFRVFRALRLLRLSLLSGNLSTMKSNRGALISGSLNVPLLWLMASVVAWMFTSASCVAVMEKWLWHDALYFVASTLTTVGYGDVVVKSSIGRLFVMGMMLVGVVLIPVRASQLYSRLHERLTVAGHPPGDAPGCKGAYAVLSGRLSDVRGFNDFLQDFLVMVRALPAAAGQRGRNALQLVCLCNKPSVEFLALQELHETHLTLVEGSAFSEKDLLQRAALAGSVGAMVLADRFSSNAAAEDTDVQFRVWAIKSAVKRMPLYVQVLRRASVDVISPFLDPSQDVITSIEGTRLRLLALSCFVPGTSTLIANLLRSSGPNAGFAGGPRHSSSSWHRHTRSSSLTSSPTASRDDGITPGTSTGTMAQQQPGNERTNSLTWGVRPLSLQSLSLGSRDGGASAAVNSGVMAGRRWLREYADGAHCELFFCPAGPPLAGLRFSNAAEAVYEATGAMLVGVVRVKSQRLLLNPGSYMIRQGQQLVVLATTHQAAEAGAAGEGLELTQLSQALQAAEATAAATHNRKHRQRQQAVQVQQAMQQRQQQQLAEGRQLAQRLLLLQQQQQQQQQQPVDDARGVTVRVPSLLAEELANFVAKKKQQMRLASEAQHTWHQQQQQQQALQQLSGYEQEMGALQPRPSGQQPSVAGSNGSSKAGVAAAAAGTAAAAVASLPPHLSRDVISQPGSSSFAHSSTIDPPDWLDEYSDEDLAHMNPCLASWSGAFESDSMDETEVCTDSELLEAALLQRQRQQRREQHQQQLLMGQVGPPAMRDSSPVGSGVLAADSVQDLGQGFERETVDAAASSSDGSSASNCSPAAIGAATAIDRTSGVFHQIQQQQQQMQRQQQQLLQPQGQPPSAPGNTSSASSTDSNMQSGQQQQQHWQQPQQSFSCEPQPAPKHLTGHIILSGCSKEFLPFAEQLHAQAPPSASPVTIVLLHPEPPPREVYDAIRALGPTYYVRGKSSDSAALAAAEAENARSLVYLGPTERPTHLSAHAVSGVYGDPTSRDSNAPTDYNSTSRTAVLADADALSSCYGVGEVLLPDILHTVVELGFTSSIRFLQPGLLLHGRSAPHSQSSYDDHKPSSGLLGAMVGLFRGTTTSPGSTNSSSSSSRSSSREERRQDPRSAAFQMDSLYDAAQRLLSSSDQAAATSSSQGSGGSGGSSLDNSRSDSPTNSRSGSPSSRGAGSTSSRTATPLSYQQQQQQQQQQLPRQPRSSFRHRKEIEEAGRAEGLTEWQLNSYYAAGRVMVPALLDTFTCQGFFKRRALLDLMTELAGDDGRPGGAMLQQLPVPTHLVGCTYRELVAHFLSSQQPHERYVPLGLLRRKAENRAWRLPYVATHPHPDAVLQVTDAVFVIRPQ